jgi:hypothetical protein
MLEYANNMEDDEEVFAIIYSATDVKQFLRDKNYDDKRLVVELLDDDIYDALRGWEGNVDLGCLVNLSDAFEDLCDDLREKHLAKGE